MAHSPSDQRQLEGTRGRALLMPVVFALAVAALYHDVLVRLFADWLHDDNYSHGLLVPPFVLWLIWRRRSQLADLPAKPSFAGAAIVLASLVLFLAGLAGFEYFLTRVSLVGVLAGTVVQVLGWRHLKALAFPFALLLLAIPLPALVFNQIAFPLQLVASRFGVATLDLLSVPALREGNIVRLDGVTLEVAEACSGVRSLVSLTTLVLAYGHLTVPSAWRRGILLMAVLPIVVVANGLRVAGAGVVAHVYGGAAAAGFLHTFSGWLFFSVSVLLLVLVERLATTGGRAGTGTRLGWGQA